MAIIKSKFHVLCDQTLSLKLYISRSGSEGDRTRLFAFVTYSGCRFKLSRFTLSTNESRGNLARVVIFGNKFRAFSVTTDSQAVIAERANLRSGPLRMLVEVLSHAREFHT